MCFQWKSLEPHCMHSTNVIMHSLPTAPRIKYEQCTLVSRALVYLSNSFVSTPAPKFNGTAVAHQSGTLPPSSLDFCLKPFLLPEFYYPCGLHPPFPWPIPSVPGSQTNITSSVFPESNSFSPKAGRARTPQRAPLVHSSLCSIRGALWVKELLPFSLYYWSVNKEFLIS